MLVTNLCMWMSDMSSAWLMTSFTDEPIWVALVQTAASLPMFLFGLPSGALADILDRRRYLLATQCWLALTAILLSLANVFDMMSAPLLLTLTFLNGIGLAMRWPVYGALVPESVPRQQLPQAIALQSVAMNMSRIVGPLLAGVLIASAGIAWVFAINAVLSTISAYVVLRWKWEQAPYALGREPLLIAMRVGLQFVAQSDAMHRLLVRVVLYFFHSSAVLALLPLLAKRLGGDAGTFSLLVASMGIGAITVAMLPPRLRQHFSKSQVITVGTLLQSTVAVIMALTSNLPLALVAMFVCGVSWLSTANSLAVSVQARLPDWVRARGYSIYQICIMGGSAIGAAVWGQVATTASLTTSLLIAALTGFLSMLMAHRFVGRLDAEEDLTPALVERTPVVVEPPDGQVVMSIEYRIDPHCTEAFLPVMQDSRRSCLQQGARAWLLMRDLAHPGRFIEQITDVSWTEHLRRLDRGTSADTALHERRLAFHLPQTPPVVTRCVIANPCD